MGGAVAVTHLVVLDSLYDDIDLETKTASGRGVGVSAWDGTTDALADADCVVHVRTTIDSELIAAMPHCRVIGRFGTGLDTVDLEAAARAGIRVIGVRDYCIPELPAHTLALGLGLQRRLPEVAGVRGSWADVARDTPLHRGRCAVVVGLGAVGRRLVAALQALGYEVLAVTRSAELAALVGLEPTRVERALAAADLLFLQTSLDDETRGFLNSERIDSLKPGVIVVNTARLGLLDEADVAAALRSGRIGGLALDAILPADSPLADFSDDPRVLISPHVGWYSEESAAELRRRAVLATIDALTTQEGTLTV
jgi:phosphoglycerate dehydrogenase-like enzyme